MPKDVLDSCYQSEIPYNMLDIMNHPTASDLERNMGKELTEMYFKTCTPIERILFGRDKPLKGPQVQQNKADGSEIQTVDTLQALTHQKILEIGRNMEVKMEELRKQELEKALKEQEEFNKFECNMRLKFHLENEKRRQEEIWMKEVVTLKEKHEKEMVEMKQFYDEGMALFKEFTLRKYGMDDQENKDLQFQQKLKSLMKASNFVENMKKYLIDSPDNEDKEELICDELFKLIKKIRLSEEKSHLEKLKGKKELNSQIDDTVTRLLAAVDSIEVYPKILQKSPRNTVGTSDLSGFSVEDRAKIFGGSTDEDWEHLNKLKEGVNTERRKSRISFHEPSSTNKIPQSTRRASILKKK